MENNKNVSKNEEKPPVTKRPLYSASTYTDDKGHKSEAIAFGKRDLPTTPVEKGVIPTTGAIKETVVYGKFNEALNRPFENLAELLQAD